MYNIEQIGAIKMYGSALELIQSYLELFVKDRLVMVGHIGSIITHYNILPEHTRILPSYKY